MKGQGNRNGTATVRPPQTKTKDKHPPPQKKATKKEGKIPNKGGVRIGECTDDDRWRCRTCKYLNHIADDECTTCGDPRPGAKKVEEPPGSKGQGKVQE